MWMMLMSALVALAGDDQPGGFDHSYRSFGAFLGDAVTDEGVDYTALLTRRASLDAHLESVAAADVQAFNRSEQVALYVNAYNGYTLKTILDEWPVKSIRDLDGGQVWKRRQFTVGTVSMTLDAMENQHARALADGRIHAVVNCASAGCPPLPPKPVVPVGLEAQLDAYAARWVRTNGLVVVNEGQVTLSKIFDWYGDDFTSFSQGDIDGVQGKKVAALWFCARYAPEPLATTLTSGGLQVAFHDYDWSINSR